MMRWFNVYGRTLSPLALRSSRQTSHVNSLDFIPGTVWRGALANLHQQYRPGKTDEFTDFFLGKSCYGNLLPVDLSGDNEKGITISQVIPLTARSCKRYPGFYNMSDRLDESHGVIDSLVPGLAFALSQPQSCAPLDEIAHCPVCQAVQDHYRGYYQRKGELLKTVAVDRQIITRVGINRATKTSQPGVLFSREVVGANNCFGGLVGLPKEFVNNWLEFVNNCCLPMTATALLPSRSPLRVGSMRTSGYGAMTIHVSETKGASDFAEQLQKRCRRFNKLVRKLCKKFNIKLSINEKFLVPLTLRSDLILPIEPGNYTGVLTPAELAKRVPQMAKSELVYQVANLKRVSGWYDLWGLPKPEEWAIAAGSVFVYALPQEPDYKLLTTDQARFFGQRQAEGYGQVEWCDEFHLGVERR